MSMDPSVGSVAGWRKSRHSMTNGNCVEIAADTDAVFVRDTTDRAGAMMRYPAKAWRAFLAAAKAGTHDPGDLTESSSALALRPSSDGN
jgi:hypothetical protein